MTITPCAPAVDRTGMQRAVLGEPVDERLRTVRAVDAAVRRPRSVLTLDQALTCDDAVRPQFPQALLQRRIHLKRRPVLVDPGDERNIR